jgi:AcrR family transcriptional regulator
VADPSVAAPLAGARETLPADQQSRRLAAVTVALPEGVTPPGTRGRILEAALGLFAEWGYHGASIRTIGAAAGINSATMYSHFASKEEVLRELVLIGHTELFNRLTASVEALTAPTDRLRALVRAQVLAHTDYPLLAVVTNSELHVLSPAAAAASVQLRSACVRLVLDALEDGQRDGSFDVADVALLTQAIAGMGVRVGNWFGPDQPYSREDVADGYADYALRMAGASGAARGRVESSGPSTQNPSNTPTQEVTG